MSRFIVVVLLLMLCVPNPAIAGLGARKTTLVLWGPKYIDEAKGIEAAIAEFERRHPGIKVQHAFAKSGDDDSGKLMTAIAGGSPPDVVRQERFWIGDWASRGAFMPLDNLVKNDPSIKNDDYYKACWDECIYKGKLYGIPYATGSRALYYNRTLFRMAGLDPNRPPRTWDELLSYAKKLTAYNKNGGFTRIGFDPFFGNSFLQTYSFANGGEAMSSDGRRCTLNNPRTVAALQYVVSFYDAFGGADKIAAFEAGLGTQTSLDPFAIGLVAMKIDGDWALTNIAKFAPDLDFGVAPIPVPRARYEGKAPFTGQPKWVTWSGGFAYVIPTGARHVGPAWEFIKWMLSEEATMIAARAQSRESARLGRPYSFVLTARPMLNETLYRDFHSKDKRLVKAQRVFIDLMRVSHERPVTIVGQRLWSEQARAWEMAIRHRKTPQQALNEATSIVQKELDEALNRKRFGYLNIRFTLGCVLAVALILGVFVAVSFRRQRMGRLSRKEMVVGYAFASPWIIGFLAFTIGPIIASVVLSFCDYDVISPARWIGLRNYVQLLTSDSHLVSKSLYNVAFLAAFGLPLNLITSLLIAMLLNTKVRGMNWYRTVYYLPSIVPVVANLILWMWILQPEYGLINAAWKATLTPWLGLAPPLWLVGESSAKPALILMGLWGAGGGIILWLAGLQGVPRQLYEAAEIDGAAWWAKFRNVTLPMLTPYIFFNLIMGTIGVLQTFEASYIMTKGGPADSTLVPALYLFNNAFIFFKMGYASALAWLLFVIVLALTLTQTKLASRWVYYEHGKDK